MESNVPIYFIVVISVILLIAIISCELKDSRIQKEEWKESLKTMMLIPLMKHKDKDVYKAGEIVCCSFEDISSECRKQETKKWLWTGKWTWLSAQR